MGNSASSEQQQQEEAAFSNNTNTNNTNNTKAIKITQSKASDNPTLDITTPSISYSSPLSPPIPGMMQQVINNNNDNNDNNINSNNNNDNNNTEETTTNTNTNTNIDINNNNNSNNTENINNHQSNTSTTTSSDTTTLPKPVPGRSGWVSSTGASSPWYGGGSLSSSASSTHPQPYGSSYQQQQTKSSHRQSISGPYYRARGMSVNQQQEPSEDYLINNNNNQQQLLQPSPSTSTSQQLPRLQLQQLQINSPSLSSPLSATKPDSLPKEKSTPGIPTIITWSDGGNNVYVTGTFNGWKHKIPLVKSTHDFNTVIDLPLGTNRLKFIVDDEWKCSNEMETATDPDGNLVNYLQVLDEDDVEDDTDIFGREGSGDVNNKSGGSDEDNDDDSQYTNKIPEELILLAEAVQTAATDPHSMDQQKRDAIEWERKQPQPPTLPPHLEKVLLNSQNVSEEDNSILPTPNHVTLNHLYACSIKDQVMALSTTTRYRKKYVTTMYYRPVQ